MTPRLSPFDTTVAAVATPPGAGGIAVIRVSGNDALAIVARCWHGADLAAVASHTAHLGEIRAADGEIIDQAVATVFRAPRSFTGEETVELSIHGGRWLQAQVLARIMECGAVAAGRGEFSKRAFINGKLDLAQAEGIADMIAADSRAAHRLAVSQATGRFSRRIDELRRSLIDFASMLELELDFSEEDVEFADRDKLKELCSTCIDFTTRLADSFRLGKIFKEGVPTVIAGRPNAGKSTLLNRLADDDLAIVCDTPGTTRDVIETTVEISAIKFRLYDTAGLHDNSASSDPHAEIEREGMLRTRRKLAEARLVLWLADAAEDDGTPEVLTSPESLPEDATILILLNKTDRPGAEANAKAKAGEWGAQLPAALQSRTTFITLSAKEGDGVDRVKEAMATAIGADNQEEPDLLISNARHYALLRQAAEALTRARTSLEEGLSPVLTAQDVREAIDHLSTITGSITPETLLQTVFSRFCIGK